jgi:uncharacterized protein (TIGR00251 family)
VQSKRDSVTPSCPPWLRRHGEGFVLELHVQPAARRSAVVGTHGERLKVAVSAPAIDGRANAAVLRLLADRLGCRAAAVSLAAGESGRDKRIVVRMPTATLQDIVAKLLAK